MKRDTEKKTYNIVVVEPHADDAYLSLHEHLIYWKQLGLDVCILTAFATEKRIREAQEYAKRVGADQVTFMKEREAHEFSETMLLNSFRKALQTTIKNLFGFDRAPLRKHVEKSEFGRLLLPLGIQHPEHKVVSNCYREESIADREMFTSAGILVQRYLDQPYVGKQKNERDVDFALKGRVIQSYMISGATKYAPSITGIFKSQAKFFHFNPKEKLLRNSFEIIVT